MDTHSGGDPCHPIGKEDRLDAILPVCDANVAPVRQTEHRKTS